MARRNQGLLYVELLMEAERDPEFAQAYRAAHVPVLEQIEAMIRHLCRYAGCEQNVDSRYVAYVVQTFVNGLLLGRTTIQLSGTTPGQQLVRLIRDLLGRPPRLERTHTP
jgi:hypothetical protein